MSQLFAHQVAKVLEFQLQHQFSSVQSLSRAQLFATPWTAARQASLFIINSQSPPKPMSIESMMPSNHLIFCRPLLPQPSIFTSIKVFSNESVLHIRWPKYWSFSFSISPFNEYSGLISFRMNWVDLLAVPGKANSASRRDPSGCEDAEELGSEHLDCSNAYRCHDRNPALTGFSKKSIYGLMCLRRPWEWPGLRCL